jgi:phosphatidylglycerophosphatase A
MYKWEKFLGSGFYSGYIPFASGTFGSLAALLIYLIPGFEKIYILLPAIIVFTILGFRIGNKFEELYGKDPSQCTIDEVVGMWISLLFIPKTFFNLILCFFVWRLLDIIKPYPAGKLEELPGGYGIMMDDIVASLYSLIIVHIIIKLHILLHLF